MPKTQTDYFVDVVTNVVTTSFRTKLEAMRDKVREWMKEQEPIYNSYFVYVVVPGNGYYFPSGNLPPKSRLNQGLFTPSGIKAVPLTATNNDKLFNSLVQLDNDIVFVKTYYSFLSNKYGRDKEMCDWVFQLLPKVTLTQVNTVFSQSYPFDMSPITIEPCDKANYDKFYKLLASNAAMSALL